MSEDIDEERAEEIAYELQGVLTGEDLDNCAAALLGVLVEVFDEMGVRGQEAVRGELDRMIRSLRFEIQPLPTH